MTSRRLRAARRREQLEKPQYGWIWKPLLVLLIAALAVMAGLGIWWSMTPRAFDVEVATEHQRGSLVLDKRGAVSVATLKQLLDTLQDKPGGYLRDDILPPGLVMDNMPSWEWGVLRQSQVMSHSLASLDPQGAPSIESLDAVMRGNADNWLISSTGKQLETARGQVSDYLQTFSESGSGAFQPSGKGLAVWLAAVRTELIPLTERLSASVGDADMLRELGIAVPESADVPWYRIDNDLHQTRGQTWALLHLMEAMLRDQRDVIAAAGMLQQWQRVQAELQRTQRHLWSPVVLRGSGFGIFANYPLTMAHHLTRIGESLVALESGLAAAPEVSQDQASGERPAEDAEPQPGSSGGDGQQLDSEHHSTPEATGAGEESTGSEEESTGAEGEPAETSSEQRP